ncbi:hypothetical protein KQX54_021572 [Cotesia glomerata]|uniref:Uncharacterized protein n=1 Tax=Cotesia glomerata TaxID=32391 RepID=A0AAV7J7I5_COTGL|nr:hypothetical protein KQX54_021572 [Cotesia glomerata]
MYATRGGYGLPRWDSRVQMDEWGIAETKIRMRIENELLGLFGSEKSITLWYDFNSREFPSCLNKTRVAFKVDIHTPRLPPLDASTEAKETGVLERQKLKQKHHQLRHNSID